MDGKTWTNPSEACRLKNIQLTGGGEIEVGIKLLKFPVDGDNDHHYNDDEDDDDNEEDDYTTEMPGVVGGVGRIANLLM